MGMKHDVLKQAPERGVARGAYKGSWGPEMRGTEQQSGFATGRKMAGRSWAGIKGALTDKCRQCPERGLRPPHGGWIGLVRLGKLSPAASMGIYSSGVLL